ncbi:FecR domain-containing protein [Sphingomonas sp.]|uniref:FecR domain-containing protein n=1 Tax=Sphingomonas sp. TaxID=28214 RepID=UPI002FCB74AC
MRKIIIGLSPLLLAIPSISIAAPLQWQVSEASGEVRLTHDGQSRAAVRGALLASGSTITTGARARAVIVRGEEFVVISPGSQLRVPAANSPNTVMQMIEDFGTAVFKIKKKSTPHFGVQTPYLAAVVKGTTFTVTVGPEGGSVQVTEGAVEVSTLDGGAADLVEPGDIASVGASDLYQLTIEGDGSKIIRSEKGPAASGVVTSSNALPAQGASATSTVAASGTGAFSGPATQSFTIGFAIAENPQSLGAVTDGLVEGDLAMEFAAAAVHDMRGPDGRLNSQDGDTRGGSNAAPGQGNDTPGRSGDAPGQVGDTPGKSGDAPGQVGDRPGNSGEAPGQVGVTPGKGGEAPGQVDGTPGNNGEAPGQVDETPGNSGEIPGNSGSDNSGSGSDNSGSGNSGSGSDNSGSGSSNSGSGSNGSDTSADAAAEKAAKEAEQAAADAAEEAAKAAEEAAKEAAKADNGLCVAGAVCVNIL